MVRGTFPIVGKSLIAHSHLLVSIGHQRTVPISIGYIQWLSLVKPTLKVVHDGRTRFVGRPHQ